MTPNQKAHVQQLMGNGKIEDARMLLDKFLQKYPSDKDAIELRADLETLYPETRLVKGAKAANKLVFYVLLGITLFMVGAVIFGALWMRIPR